VPYFAKNCSLGVYDKKTLKKIKKQRYLYSVIIDSVLVFPAAPKPEFPQSANPETAKEFCNGHKSPDLRGNLRRGYNSISTQKCYLGQIFGWVHKKSGKRRFRTAVHPRACGEHVHDGNPLMAWCLSNALEVTDMNEGSRLTKKTKMGTQRIDLASATINALSRALVPDLTESPYETRGVRVIGDDLNDTVFSASPDGIADTNDTNENEEEDDDGHIDIHEIWERAKKR
jgi:hypothetical protein